LIAAQLREARSNPHDDSPLFQLVDDLPRWEIDHIKTDIFRKVVDYSKYYKDRLAFAVKQGAEAVQKIASEPGLANLLEVETGIVVDLFLSLRDVKAYDAMIKLYDRMPMALQRAKMMREQLGFALNRAGRFEEAEKALKAVIAEFGPSSETNALLGRVYKDRWERAKLEGRIEARSLLRRAIDAYVEGFEADWRDSYPGVNALTLMEFMDKPDPRQADMLPVVRYSASQRAKKSAGYWDHATLLELAVLARDPDEAHSELSEALASERESWEMESTVRNLRLVHDMRAARGEDAAWIKSLEEALAEDSRRLAGPRPDTR
jgi:tetratricopeptide (TPR) repeat protein